MTENVIEVVMAIGHLIELLLILHHKLQTEISVDVHSLQEILLLYTILIRADCILYVHTINSVTDVQNLIYSDILMLLL